MPDLHAVSITAILVNKEGKFLIAKRADFKKNWPGMWTVPGGKLEKKDYENRKFDTKASHWYNVIENTIRREVKEEVGLELGSVEYLVSLAFMRADDIPAVVISLYSEDYSGEVVLNDELVEYKWVNLEEAKNYDLIEGIYEELEIADKKLKNIKEKWKGKY